MITKRVVVALALMATVACGDDDGDSGGDGGSAGEGANEAGSGGSSGDGAAGEGGTGAEEQVARGQYLVDHVIACSDCHTPRGPEGPMLDLYMAGAECFAELPNGSCLNTPNLTNHETGLANRTDEEIKTMITQGLRPSAAGNEPLHPAMPYYVFANTSEDDLDAIIAYLRTIEGVDNAVPRSGPEFEVEAPVDPIDPDTIPMPAEDYPEQEAALRGRYLTSQVGLCIECHTPHQMSATVLDPATYFQGGESFDLGLPVVPVSKNITSDPATGIGDWTVDEIVAVLKEGVDSDGAGICPPMPAGPMAAYGGLTDDDARDMAHYLKSLPAIENEIEDMCTWPPM
ncbi:MAG TPA: c-type cytochrome [Polyangiaceae bacterium]